MDSETNDILHSDFMHYMIVASLEMSDEPNIIHFYHKTIMNTNNPEIKFANISVSFEEFVDALATKVALRIYQIEKGQLEISQAKAFKMFGRADVERWVKSGKLTPCRISPGKKRYKLADLQKLASIQQNYLIK